MATSTATDWPTISPFKGNGMVVNMHDAPPPLFVPLLACLIVIVRRLAIVVLSFSLHFGSIKLSTLIHLWIKFVLDPLCRLTSSYRLDFYSCSSGSDSDKPSAYSAIASSIVPMPLSVSVSGKSATATCFLWLWTAQYLFSELWSLNNSNSKGNNHNHNHFTRYPGTRLT